MRRKQHIWDDLGVTAELSLFIPTETSNACEECHAMLHVEPRGENFEGQLSRLGEAEQRLIELDELQGANAVFKRFFLSDATNQRPVMAARRRRSSLDDPILGDMFAASIIQQPPLDGSKVAVWIYLQKGSTVYKNRDVIIAEHNGYRHLYQWGLCIPEGDSYSQTRTLLEDYEDKLHHFGANIADHCIRTWFYVRDVDIQYAGMVRARKENFIAEGLTEKTHYIASTGIGGLPAEPHGIVQLDTYAMLGLEPSQQHYLYAPTHLNPTYEYGVTFERGTTVEYGDRAQVYISGTASINNKGEVVHVGDIVRQTERMWENVQTLLSEADTTFDDVAQIIVYLRDMADYQTVKEMFDRKFPDIPRVFTLAPVCRPTWLIEMECIAIPKRDNSQYRNF